MQVVSNPYRTNHLGQYRTSENSVQKVRINYFYAYQGSEQDNELKGEGNSYDFGARMYDPRVGRWLTIDPLAGKQPDQSPYKAFLNNPIIWCDPDGRTEFLTVIVKDESSGKYMKISVPVSEQIMTDGKKHAKGNNATWHYENAYYDFARVTKITIKKNGDIVTTQYTEILKDRGVKDWDYVWFGGNKWGDKQDEPSPFKMKGGFYMTGSGGQGTKYYSDNAEDIGNVDGLIGALGGLGSGGISKKTPTISPEEVLNFIKAASEATGHMDNIEELYKEVKEVVTPANKQEGNKESDDTYRCPTCSQEFPASDTTGHNQELNRESGPFEKVEKKGGN